MRKLLMAASAAAIAISMPALAKPDKEGKGGGGKPEHAQKADKGQGGGHKSEFKAAKADRPQKADRGFARQEIKPEKQFRKEDRKADKGWAKSEARREAKRDKDWARNETKGQKQWRKDEQKADKQFARQQDRLRDGDRRLRNEDVRYTDRRYDDGGRRMANLDNCPPGLARKNNGCLPPGQAGKLALGQRLPEQYFSSYNVPVRYQDWYQDGGDYSYRYGDGNIYRVDSGTNLISGLIPLLGGGFGIGSLLPQGYDVYNLPTQYRDDYVDSNEAMYRYGDNAIYQVDPKTSMIEAVVALLAGNMNVEQALPAGYDSYNLPMQYRDQYVDSDQAMYRYADNNIYEIDPKTQIIQQIVASLI